jgi:hypothetical protein
MGDVMAGLRPAAGDRIIDPMIALGRCTTRHRILVVGSKSGGMMVKLHRRGYERAFSSGNCGRPAGQYDVALVDWRRRTLHDLEAMLVWLGKFLSSSGTLVIWVDAQKPGANQSLRASLEKRGYVIEQDAEHECGRALAARLSQTTPLKKAA